MRRIKWYGTAWLVLALIVPAATGAQTIPPPGTPAEEIQRQIDAQGLRSQLLERLQTSGLTPDQIRQELARRGYDPTLLDPYLESSSTPAPEPSAGVLSAVEALGMLEPVPVDTMAMDSLAADSARRVVPDSIAIERERGLRVFGLEVFRTGTTRFQPVTTGPVPPNYVVGPGDELILLITGDVERSYTLPVTREGFVVVPQVGQIWVNGLTLGEVRDQFYTHLGRAYSGIGRGPEASTHFQLSLGQLRPNQVFVSGQVVQPGAYLVNAVASTLNALYHAGGPKPGGSFRDVRVMRGDELVERVDLYQYLVEGDNLADVRLAPGDVVFVPPHRALASVEGEVINPAIYEVLPGETLLDLIQFAGGLEAPAHLRRARITRILPPEERTVPGIDRTVIDVDLAALARDPGSAPEIRAGDAVEIFPVRSEVRNVVTIRGGVWHPGTFRFDTGMRLWDLVDRAQGLREDAYTGRAQIVRVDPQDSTLSLIPVSLRRAADGTPESDPLLREFDSVRVFEESEFTTHFPVTISGEIRGVVMDTLTGERTTMVVDTFYEGMTLKDLILHAGGLRPTADLAVEVARLADPTRTDRDQIAEVVEVRVDSSYFVSDQDRRFYFGGDVPGDGPAAEFLLRPYDRVLVRPLPEFEFQRAVQIRGEVRYPGTYTLERKTERLSDVLDRAGGLTSTAFPGGFQLYRDDKLVNVDLEAVLAGPGSRDDVVLLPEDSIFIPEYNPVVIVQGAVNSPEAVAVLYEEGQPLGYYIDNAGGYARFADRDGVHIRYANGEGAAVRQFLIFQTSPEPRPGSVVTVPALTPEDRTDWTEVVTRFGQLAGTLTTLLVLITRL